VAQAVPTRDATKSGWRWPRLRFRIDPTRAGVCLALSAWLLQAYVGMLLDSRDRLARSIETAETQREFWLIEYNSSLIRSPRNSRVTARAAYQVVCNSHQVLALSDIAHGGLLTRSGPILEQLREKHDWARELFDARDYGQLVAELDAVSQVFEERTRVHSIGMPSPTGIVQWWQHLPPVLFLLGMALCFKGRRQARADE
jgi:hypothetical protein